MEKEEYLSEEKYQKNAQNLKKVGKILLIIGVVILVLGVVLTILGFSSFGRTAVNSLNVDMLDSNAQAQAAGGIVGSIGIFALGGFVDLIGFGLTVAGGILLLVAHRREITAFTTQQVMPVAEEGIEKITPTIANAAESISKSITKGKKAAVEDIENKKGDEK